VATQPYRYSTKEIHHASGMYDYGFRFYSPGLGRWINRDPIREQGGANMYAFSGNTPLNAMDAHGLLTDAAMQQVEQTFGHQVDATLVQFSKVRSFVLHEEQWLRPAIYHAGRRFLCL
jgi:RHS repeat-associated protein